MKRDLTTDRREKCSCCGNPLDEKENVFRCNEHATEPNIFPTEGYKYNGHQVVDFSQAVYCKKCTDRFDLAISKLNIKNENRTTHGNNSDSGL